MAQITHSIRDNVPKITHQQVNFRGFVAQIPNSQVGGSSVVHSALFIYEKYSIMF